MAILHMDVCEHTETHQQCTRFLSQFYLWGMFCSQIQEYSCKWCAHFLYAVGIRNSVFLFGSTRDTEGFVALYDVRWNSLMVAPSHWTDTHADVVCRQVGYGGGVVPSDTSGYRWVCRWFIQLHCYTLVLC